MVSTKELQRDGEGRKRGGKGGEGGIACGGGGIRQLLHRNTHLIVHLSQTKKKNVSSKFAVSSGIRLFVDSSVSLQNAAVAITAAPAPGATASAATATAAGCTVHARKFMLPRALHDLTFNVHVTRTRVMYAKAASDKKACVCFAELTDDDEDDDEDNDDDDVDGDEEDEKVSRGHRAVDVEDDNEDDVGDAGADGTFRVLKIQKLQGLE
ncbi:LOW QUALITY PROTEIN: hypothetical protein V1477_017987 [Vespula maculifrons]|uniref:Uncharacterized protein n=1 Tax=Vespula maculifrons TaxID=7453 RepID=A0ABD2AZX7_VESMC